MTEQTQKRKAGCWRSCLIATLVLVCGIIALSVWMRARFYHFDDQKFDKRTWLSLQNSVDSRSPRGQMRDDLLKHHLHVGMHRAVVMRLLGQPDAGGHASDAPPSPKDGSMYSYALGHWNCPFCESTLDVYFDKQDIVTKIDSRAH